MVRGKKIHVFIVNEQGVLIRIRQAKASLKGLSVISTVVKRALVTHNKRTNYATVNEIVLPTDDIRAYETFLAWVDDVIAAGAMVPLRQITKQPLSCYTAVSTICDKLKIGYLATGLRSRVLGALEPSLHTDKAYTINVEDMKQLLTALAPTHTIRKKAVDTFDKVSLARGWSNGSFRKYKQLLRDVVGLGDEVKARMAELNYAA